MKEDKQYFHLLKHTLIPVNPCKYWDAFSYYLSYLDYLHLQKLMWGLKIVQTLAINLLTSIDPC